MFDEDSSRDSFLVLWPHKINHKCVDCGTTVMCLQVSLMFAACNARYPKHDAVLRTNIGFYIIVDSRKIFLPSTNMRSLKDYLAHGNVGAKHRTWQYFNENSMLHR